MISIDRSSQKSVTEQLAGQLRYKLASGQYKAGDSMPSTRALADQVGVSFHSVRKAYQELEREGLLESHRGAGYRVLHHAPLAKEDRIERGAALVRQSLEQLIGLGLDGSEIEYLFQEQLDLIESAGSSPKVIFGSSCAEIADLCAQQIAFILQQPVEAILLNDLARHQDADYVVTPFETVRHALENTSHGDVIGVSVHLQHEAVEQVARLTEQQTVGLVSLYPETIQPLTAQLRHASGFPGQILAASVEGSSGRLDEFARQVDLFLYTPGCRRRLLAILGWKQPSAPIAPVVSQESLSNVRKAVSP